MNRALIPTTALLFTALLAAPQARAEHSYSGLEAVRAIAHDLEDATRDLYYAARHERHHFDRRERHALDDLYRLNNRARHFHREIERHYRDPYHTESDFRELRLAADHVLRGRRDLHPTPVVDHQLRRVAELMARLDAYYAEYTGWGRYDPHWRGRGHWYGGFWSPRIWFEWWR